MNMSKKKTKKKTEYECKKWTEQKISHKDDRDYQSV